MMMIRTLAIVGMGCLSACSGAGGNTAPPLTAAAPAMTDSEDMNTPNDLPSMTRPGTTVEVGTDVVGVTHLPP